MLNCESLSEMQNEHERLSIRYKPNLGKRSQLYNLEV